MPAPRPWPAGPRRAQRWRGRIRSHGARARRVLRGHRRERGRQVGSGLAAPEAQDRSGGIEDAEGGEFAGFAGLACFAEQVLGAAEVDGAFRHGEPVAGGERLDQVVAERRADARHQGLERRPRPPGWFFAPDVLRESLARDGTGTRQRQRHDEGLASLTGGLDEFAGRVLHRDRTEHGDAHAVIARSLNPAHPGKPSYPVHRP